MESEAHQNPQPAVEELVEFFQAYGHAKLAKEARALRFLLSPQALEITKTINFKLAAHTAMRSKLYQAFIELDKEFLESVKGVSRQKELKPVVQHHVGYLKREISEVKKLHEKILEERENTKVTCAVCGC